MASLVFPDSLIHEITSVEKAWLEGAFVAAITYGIEFVLYAMTCFFLWKSRNQFNNRRNLVFILYTTIIFLLATLYLIGLLVSMKEAFIDQRNPSLPLGLATITMFIKGWLCDVINIWRSIVIYQGCRAPSWCVNIVPYLLAVTNVALGIFYLVNKYPLFQIGLRDPTGFQGPNVFPYMTFILSLVLNLLITILLLLRLLFFRNRIIQLLGRAQGK